MEELSSTSTLDVAELEWSIGGGVSSELELTDELSLIEAPLDAVGAGVAFPLLSLTNAIGFMETRMEAASSSCTCWCLEMSSFEVSDHSGVCSHLFRLNRRVTAGISQRSQCKVWKVMKVWCHKWWCVRGGLGECTVGL